MGTVAQLLAWARDQEGTTENPPGSNHVRYWHDVGMDGAQGQPWCAAFVLAGLTATATRPVSRSVYVPRLVQDYKTAGRFHPITEAQPGDQVLYGIGAGHTGVVVSTVAATRTLTAIEGNTSSGTGGSQDNGGGVFQRTRSWSTAIGVGRPFFDVEVKSMFDPPVAMKPVVAGAACPTGGFWLVSSDGDVYAFLGAPYQPWPNKPIDFANRKVATIAASSDAAHPYVITATSGERYAP